MLRTLPSGPVAIATWQYLFSRPLGISSAHADGAAAAALPCAPTVLRALAQQAWRALERAHTASASQIRREVGCAQTGSAANDTAASSLQVLLNLTTQSALSEVSSERVALLLALHDTAPQDPAEQARTSSQVRTHPVQWCRPRKHKYAANTLLHFLPHWKSSPKPRPDTLSIHMHLVHACRAQRCAPAACSCCALSPKPTRAPAQSSAARCYSVSASVEVSPCQRMTLRSCGTF